MLHVYSHSLTQGLINKVFVHWESGVNGEYHEQYDKQLSMKIIMEYEKHMDYFLIIFGNYCNIQ